MCRHASCAACRVSILGVILSLVTTAVGCGDSKLFTMTAHTTSGHGLMPGFDMEGFQPMPPTNLTVILQQDSHLLITFSAVGSVPPEDTPPVLQIRCEIDGRSCSNELPDAGVTFLYHDAGHSAGCCLQDSQLWMTARIRKGFHHITILGRLSGSAASHPPIGDWSLIVEAIDQ
jgi:hypothetical protein